MARIIIVKNTTGSDDTWLGQIILAGESQNITQNVHEWSHNSKVFTSIGNGDLVVNDGSEDITDSVKAWEWILGDNLPYSKHLEGKLAVHSSSKPEPDGVETFAVWTGAGDDITETDQSLSLGNGALLAFNMVYGVANEYRDIKFDPRHGRVWIHEAYVKFENGGVADYLTADIMAPATALQQAVDLDYIIENDWLKYSPSGAGTGTHGLAATPVLVPHTFTMTGDWDYDGTNLTPNFAGTGNYKITTIERVANRYFNKIPLYGTSATYFTMSSEETAELPISSGYFIRINVENISNSNWSISIIMELYREVTFAY